MEQNQSIYASANQFIKEQQQQLKVALIEWCYKLFHTQTTKYQFWYHFIISCI